MTSSHALSAPLSPAAATDGAAPALLCLISAFAVGHALQLGNGTLDDDALRWLTGALALMLMSATLVWTARLQQLAQRLLAPVGTLLFLHQLHAFTRTMPGMYLRLGSVWDLTPLFSGLAFAALLVGAGLGENAWLGRLRLPLLLAVHFLLGTWLIHASPSPAIDVHVFQRDASLALLSGQNPYAMTFPDIYGGTSPFYGEGLSVNGRLLFGFPYPPLSLWLVLPGQVLGDDHRYAQLAAVTLAGGLMAYARPGRLASLAAALYLFTPRSLFVLEQGWTEPFVVLGLAAVAYCACRLPRAVPYALGLFLATKQYLVFALPLALLLLERPFGRRELWAVAWRAVVTGLVVSLPLVLWDLRAFVHSAVTLQMHQPFRPDALSYLAWWARGTGAAPGVAPAFLVALLAVALVLWRAPRSAHGFALGAALVFGLFFAFNKQAFANYYYFVIGALCVAAATASVSTAPEAHSSASAPRSGAA